VLLLTVASCGSSSDSELAREQAAIAEVLSFKPETLGEILVDAAYGNVERVTLTADNRIRVVRRNGERYSLGGGQKLGEDMDAARDRDLALEFVEALRYAGVIVNVEGRADSRGVFGAARCAPFCAPAPITVSLFPGVF
jgi:hypothetical protein